MSANDAGAAGQNVERYPPSEPGADLAMAAPLPQDVLDRVADAVLTVDAEWRFTSLNRSARHFLARLGRDPARLLGGAIWEQFPELRGTALERAARQAVATRDEVRLDFHYPPTGGWYAVRLVPLASGLIALALDVTAVRRAEAERARAEAAERRSERILASIADAFCVFDGDWRFAFANARAAKLAGVPATALLGRSLWELYPGTMDDEYARQLRRAMVDQCAVVFEMPSPAGGDAWVEVHAYPSPDGLAVHLHEITERKRSEARTRFLNAVSVELAASLDPATTLQRVAELAVPAIGDWCVVLLTDDDDRVQLAAVAHQDERRCEHAERLLRRHLALGGPPVVLGRVLREGRSLLLPVLDDGSFADRLVPSMVRDWLEEIGLRGAVVAPLRARERVLGALALVRTDAHAARYGAADLTLVEDLARRAATALDNARLYHEAVEANSAKANFLAVMSHELRTPLTAIIGYTELMADEIVGPVNEVQREQLSRVRASGAHLLTLIEEILAFARIEAGQEQVRHEAVPVADVVHEACSVVEPLLARKAVRLERVVPQPSPVLQTDPGKLRQILLNLLANAIKFTDAGEVRVVVSGAHGHLAIAVQDTGIGIEPANLARIFDPFWQVEQARTRRVGGTGLGLSVARQLTQLLGGELTVTSTPGVGTTFRLVFLPGARGE